MGLEFPVKQTYVDDILHIRQMELKRFAEWPLYKNYVYMHFV
jgi:hypothetical protein